MKLKSDVFKKNKLQTNSLCSFFLETVYARPLQNGGQSIKSNDFLFKIPFKQWTFSVP